MILNYRGKMGFFALKIVDIFFNKLKPRKNRPQHF